MLIWEQFAHQDIWNRSEAHGISNHENYEAKQRKEFQSLVIINVLEVEEGAENGQRDEHDETGHDQKDLSAGLVHQKNRD